MSTKVITGKQTRWSYANVFEPKTTAGGDLKYSVSLLIPKDDEATLSKIKAAMREAYDEGKSKLAGNGKTAPAYDIVKKPLRDGDMERPDDPAYAGHYFLNASSKDKPGIINALKQKIEDRSEVYSGCYGPASINFFAYNSNGNKGIGVGLNNLMKWKDGEPLSGRASAESDFADFEMTDEEIEEF